MIPYCQEHGIGVVPFSPVASGFLSGSVTEKTNISGEDDVRQFVPQLSAQNIAANLSILELLEQYAEKKEATKAQIALAWMLAKYPNVAPIPGSKNKGRILENLKASEILLTAEELSKLEQALDSLPVQGHRGQVEYDGMSMSEWGKGK